MTKECIIYDFETLSQKPTGVVVCTAALRFNENRYLSDNPYVYQELVDSSEFIKFSIREQVEMYGRGIQRSVIEWWKNQPKDAQQLLEPSDVDRPLADIIPFFENLIGDSSQIDKVYTRGNNFDPIFMDSILENLNSKSLYGWWLIRDTRSMIEGLSFGANIHNKFMVPGLDDQFIAHDPRHDIAMDVMRMQHIVRLLNDPEV